MKNLLDRKKLKSRLVRKGVFTQLPILDKDLEKETILFRTVVDYAIFDILSEDFEARKDALKFINPESSCVPDFEKVCSLASLHPAKTRHLIVYFVDKYFPEVFEQNSCSFVRQMLV